MSRPVYLLFGLWLCFSAGAVLAGEADYAVIDLDVFITDNQIPDDGTGKNQRTMLRPAPVQFVARLLQAPQPGQFDLVYDALALWPHEGPPPEVSHSAFLQSSGEQVLAAYVSKPAAQALLALHEQAGQALPVRVYALHLYNYSKGPRLLVIAVQPVSP